MTIFNKMSNSDSSFDNSYDSDDSEVKYIPGYVEIEVEDQSVASETAELDPEKYRPYEDEPIASEEWLAEYSRKQETQAQFEQKLQGRFDRRGDVSWW